ncbi:MAG: FUSC family protein [Microthrixaceae bacterium]
MTYPVWLTAERRRVLRRAVKIALAAMLATLVAKLLDLPNPWFATLAAIVAVEITIQASLRSGRNAILGAGIGAAVGLGLAVVAKDQIWAVGLVVLLAFAVGGWVRLEPIGRQSAIVASVIVLVPESTRFSTEYFAWIRFSETVIGIAAALGVNALILPPRAHRGVRRNLAHAYEQLAVMYRSVVAAEATGRRDLPAIVQARRTFRTRMRAVDDLWDEAMAERPPPEVLAPHWRATTRRIWEQCTAMDDSVMEAGARGQLAGARSELRDLAEATASALDAVAVALHEDLTPLPSAHALEAPRVALLERVRSLEVTAWSLPFAQALQVFTFINGMTVIASRLTDLDVELHREESELDSDISTGTGTDTDASG